MTENKDKLGGGGNGNGSDRHKKNGADAASPAAVADKDHEKDKDSHDRIKKLTQLLTEKRPAISGAAATPSSTARIDARNLLQLPPVATTTPSPLPAATAASTPAVSPTSSQHHQLHQQLQQQQQQLLSSDELRRSTFYRTVCASFQSAILLLDMDTGEISDFTERSMHKDEFGTQRVYKKTSPNCVLTLYLPTREITLSGNNPSILRGIIYVDPKAIQGYRVYAQLTLTFRYGREDEEVMGLRFCNEAIMSLHQVWPRNEEPARESLSPLQEALVKRLGDGAHPFTLTLTPQAPPSVQLVPAKRYYGAPIGTSYDVRCFIADKTDEKFHRRASVKMGVRVIYRTDVFHNANGAENFAALLNNQAASPPTTATLTSPPAALTATEGQLQAVQPQPPNGSTTTTTALTAAALVGGSADATACQEANVVGVSLSDRVAPNTKPRKSERGDSFPKLRLSPKSFRFSGRFGRSKSEIERCPNDPFYNYSKSFQEYDSSGGSSITGIGGSGSGVAVGGSAVGCVTHGAGAAAGAGLCSGAGSCGSGPQGAVDKPFLLQDGRVGLRASLDKAWYTHGEDVCVTVNIRNDSRKTVRKVRVCAIQHVDVCMFNNGKFKNIVADSDVNSPMDRTVPPGGTLNTTIVLKPQRGQTKNWIALEDTLQRSTEPEEITGAIAASAIRSPNLVLPAGHTLNPCPSPAVGIPQPTGYHGHGVSGNVGDDRNVFAIYVSYYVKVKLTLSGMGGELSLKLPFVLVHVEETQRAACDAKVEKLALDDVPACKKNGSKIKTLAEANPEVIAAESASCRKAGHAHANALDRIESVDDEIRVPIPSGISRSSSTSKRRLVRSETLAKDLDDDTEEQLGPEMPKPPLTTDDSAMQSSLDVEHVHVVQIHTPAPRPEAGSENQNETKHKSTESNTNPDGNMELTAKESTAGQADIETVSQQDESVPLKCENTAVSAADAEADGNGSAGGGGDNTNHV